MNSIRDNYFRTLEKIAAAARRAGRQPQEVKLVVVTKGHPLETVRSVIVAGATCLGENYVDEGLQKIASLAKADTQGLEWHMIGHVQSRRARPVAEQFAYLHSLDSLKLARRLDEFSGQAGRQLPVLLECNVSGEESKSGFTAWDEPGWAALLDLFAQLLALPNLEVRGLMTMAPFFTRPEEARPYFQRLRRLRDFLRQRLSGTNWDELSMGMSGDFEPAVEEGATLVRIGTAIVGPRSAKAQSEKTLAG